MKVVRGTVKSYDQKTRKGLIILVDGEGEVRVDFSESPDIKLAVGQQVDVLRRIHGPDAVYASLVCIIS